MAAKKKRKNTKKQHNLDDIVAGRVSVSALELVRLIHQINPTRENLSEIQTAERYALKAALQSRLITNFQDSLEVQADPGNPDVVGLKLKYFDEDVCHAVLCQLNDDARSWVRM